MNKRSRERKDVVKPERGSDLKPWLAVFNMLRAYVRLDYLQIDVVKHEAYITQPALHALSEGDSPKVQIEDGGVVVTAGRIREYAAWLSGEGNGYRQANFAVHVVKHEEPHDLMYTFVFSRKLRFFKWKDEVDVIIYPEK